MTHNRWKGIWLFAIALTLAVSTRSWAVAVFFSTTPVPGGFRYDLLVDNTGGTEAIQGLTVLKGNSVFGLDVASTIGAPQDVGGDPAADWDFFAPFPPFVDSLDYFSLNPAGDVPVNGSLGGFFFESTKDPATLRGDDFAIELIGSTSGAPVPAPRTAQLIPEPSTVVLVTVGIVGLLAATRRRKKD